MRLVARVNRFAVVPLLVGAFAWSSPPSGLQPTGERVPQIESKTPGAFDDPHRPAISEIDFAYQVNATVLLPLLFVSIPIVSRDNVGFGSASSRDFRTDQGMHLRTYEFFATSNPERARGLNRLGFLREALLMEGSEVHSTAHFGVISSNREQTREEADTRLDRDESLQAYSIVDGLISHGQTTYELLELELEGRWPTAGALYAEVRPGWQTAEPDESETQPNPDGQRYPDPVGFLGGLQHSLQAVAADLARGARPRRHRQPFLHNGKVYGLELRGHSVDTRRLQRYVGERLVQPDATVHKINYRLRDERGRGVQDFEVWAELPATPEGAVPPAILPIAFEFKARAFLKLRAVRMIDRDEMEVSRLTDSTAREDRETAR